MIASCTELEMFQVLIIATQAAPTGLHDHGHALHDLGERLFEIITTHIAMIGGAIQDSP